MYLPNRWGSYFFCSIFIGAVQLLVNRFCIAGCGVDQFIITIRRLKLRLVACNLYKLLHKIKLPFLQRKRMPLVVMNLHIVAIAWNICLIFFFSFIAWFIRSTDSRFSIILLACVFQRC